MAHATRFMIFSSHLFLFFAMRGMVIKKPAMIGRLPDPNSGRFVFKLICNAFIRV
jgi:hypothetical protein